MASVLVTGMSGTGKTTLLHELARRGFRTVDTDYDGWTLADGSWDATRMTALLDQHPDVIVSGTTDNQVDFYDRFGHVVLLSVPLDVAIARVSSRTDNPYGSTAAERTEIARNTEEVEPLLRDSASVELDGRRPVAELADRVAKLVLL
ncbi:ATP-binding protein [Mycobacteroides saopaulense]|uniref:ATP-binding protein n=1 Tax=Mycobacteroides saopaulense TaxID=1578165 RepID=A0A1S4VNR9_9MYCO|nr:AAA family ATPase [Mycobacteroides saopaulense]ALR13430.1 ATP-binding protein [Mycobacteroides saopaulense]ORB59291.1 ATP-binding protein [Mycobacteroides saopaulense]